MKRQQKIKTTIDINATVQLIDNGQVVASFEINGMQSFGDYEEHFFSLADNSIVRTNLKYIVVEKT
jgi:hypothetical protein